MMGLLQQRQLFVRDDESSQREGEGERKIKGEVYTHIKRIEVMTGEQESLKRKIDESNLEVIFLQEEKRA